MKIADLIRKSAIPRDQVPMFEQYRAEAFLRAQAVYKERSVGYNLDHPPYEEMVYGPVSLASEVYKRMRRLAALLSPLREDAIRKADINRILDICIDTMNYLTWLYAIIKIASGSDGHKTSDDSPNYLEEHLDAE